MKLSVLALLVLILAALSWQALETGGMASNYPIAVTLGAMACALAHLAMSLASQRKRPDAAAAGTPTDPAAEAITWPPPLALAAFVAIWLAYVYYLETLGFVAATWLALWGSLVMLTRRFSAGAPIYIGVFVVVLTVLLKTALYVPVPQGWVDVRIDTFIYSFR